MAKGRRGGRGGSGRHSGGSNLPGRRQRKQDRGGGAKAEMAPTAAPGTAQAPATGGSSIMGGGVNIDVSRPGRIRRPDLGQRNRGGPRPESERRAARGPAVVHDFRYVRSDLQWIALTSAASLGLVAVLWAVLRA